MAARHHQSERTRANRCSRRWSSATSPTASRSARARCRDTPGSICRRPASATSWRISRRWASSPARTPPPAAYRRRAATASSSTPCSRSSRSTASRSTSSKASCRRTTRQKLVASASQLLSDLTHFAGVVMTPRRSAGFRHIEFLNLSAKRILLIIVTPEGDVQNRIILTDKPYSAVGTGRGRQHPQPELRGADVRRYQTAASTTNSSSCAKT